MLSFTSSLSPDYEAFAIFVTEKYDYKDKKDILPNNVVQKINSFLDVLKAKKKDEELNSFDISNQKKCFIIKVKNKYEDYYPQEIGGALFSYIRKFKDIKKIDFYVDSLDFDKEKTAKFFSEFIFGLSLKSYTFNKYKTLDKDKINKKIDFKIITSHKQKMEAYYKYCDAIKEGRGVIFMTPHHGSWELTGLFAASKIKTCVMYKPLRSKILNDFVLSGRKSKGTTLVETDNAGVKELLKALKNNSGIGILPDHTPKINQGVMSNIYNVPVNTTALIHKLARKNKIPTIATDITIMSIVFNIFDKNLLNF